MSIRALVINDTEALAALWRHGPFLIYKHSPFCGISRIALRQVETFADAHPDCEVVQVDVVRQCSLSRQIAAALGLAHASPQAILVVDGRVAWSATHFGVTARAIGAAVRSTTATKSESRLDPVG